MIELHYRGQIDEIKTPFDETQIKRIVKFYKFVGYKRRLYVTFVKTGDEIRIVKNKEKNNLEIFELFVISYKREYTLIVE